MSITSRSKAATDVTVQMNDAAPCALQPLPGACPRAAIERVVDSGRAAVFPSAFVRGLRWMVEELASGASASMTPAVAR